MTEGELDRSRLTPCELDVWNQYFAHSNESLTIRLWGFGHACMLLCEGVPSVAAEKLRELDPENTIRQYLDNVRRARDSR